MNEKYFLWHIMMRSKNANKWTIFAAIIICCQFQLLFGSIENTSGGSQSHRFVGWHYQRENSFLARRGQLDRHDSFESRSGTLLLERANTIGGSSSNRIYNNDDDDSENGATMVREDRRKLTRHQSLLRKYLPLSCFAPKQYIKMTCYNDKVFEPLMRTKTKPYCEFFLNTWLVFCIFTVI